MMELHICNRSGAVLRSFALGDNVEVIVGRDETCDIRIAAPWFKPTRNETELIPDYYLHETAEWLVFPHELDALTPEEMRERRPDLASIVYRDESSAA